jgi:hypothetical protein
MAERDLILQKQPASVGPARLEPLAHRCDGGGARIVKPDFAEIPHITRPLCWYALAVQGAHLMRSVEATRYAGPAPEDAQNDIASKLIEYSQAGPYRSSVLTLLPSARPLTRMPFCCIAGPSFDSALSIEYR